MLLRGPDRTRRTEPAPCSGPVCAGRPRHPPARRACAPGRRRRPAASSRPAARRPAARALRSSRCGSPASRPRSRPRPRLDLEPVRARREPAVRPRRRAGAKAPPSIAQENVDPGSLDENENTALLLAVVPSGPRRSSSRAGWRRSPTCAPPESDRRSGPGHRAHLERVRARAEPVYVHGLVQAAKAPPSSRHSKPSGPPATSPTKRNVAEVIRVGFAGPPVRAVSGSAAASLHTIPKH